MLPPPPQRSLLAYFEATLDFSRSKFAHNNISQICYCGQISLQSAAANCTFSDNVWGNIYFAGDGTVGTYIKMSLSQQYNLQILVFLIQNYVPMLEFLRADSYSQISL